MCDLILQRQQVDEWRIIYEIQQAEVKNNPDPEKSAVSGPYPCSRRCSQSQLQHGREGDKRFVYNGAAFLVVMVIADGALYEVPAVDALWKKTIPQAKPTSLTLLQMSEDLPIFRKYTKARGFASKAAMPFQHPMKIHLSNVKNAGYTFGDPYTPFGEPSARSLTVWACYMHAV
jgi:hypothetical protein